MSKHVLLIEHDRDLSEALRTLLERNGYNVETAYDGVAGIEAARQSAPDVIVCALAMPGLTGFAVASTLRSDRLLKSVRLIALSSLDAPHEALAAGFDVHVLKHSGIDRLLALL
jgi:CheY-like chemotaxis protein